eukprot:CAMPEP_0118839136 /NCGR_PEP_ID=MMETSP1162-20130426/68528_1 /TAXON_ID=33656 /ORGANISM="Phaeocystis Sp, Strain CCMP2710" /LENGTH=167 /DNA_ID=CAMNT_0006771097 /DNA_START=58 /DNA_END=557 /DNA_ORIENTATION=-
MRGFTCVPGPPSGRGSLVLWGSRASVVLVLGARVLGHLLHLDRALWAVLLDTPRDGRRIDALDRLHHLAVSVEEESRLGVARVLLERRDLLRVRLVPLDLPAHHLHVVVLDCREHRVTRPAPVSKDLHDAQPALDSVAAIVPVHRRPLLVRRQHGHRRPFDGLRGHA